MRPAGKGKSRIGKPAPLNTARVCHPTIQNRSKAVPPSHLSLGSQKIVHIDSCFAEDGAQRSLRHVARMMRDRNFSSGLRMTPNLVAACARAVKAKSERRRRLATSR